MRFANLRIHHFYRPYGFAHWNRLVYDGLDGGVADIPDLSSEKAKEPLQSLDTKSAENMCIALVKETKTEGELAVNTCIDKDDQILEERSDEGISEAVSQLSPEDIATVKDALLPETNVNKFVKMCTGQNTLEGYQKILLAPANAFEGIASGIAGLPDTISSLTTAIGEADASSLDGAGRLVWEIFTKHMTLAEQTAIAVGIGSEALTGAGLASTINKIAKSAKVMSVLAKVGKALSKVTRIIPRISKAEGVVAGTSRLATVAKGISTVGEKIATSKAGKMVKEAAGSKTVQVAKKIATSEPVKFTKDVYSEGSKVKKEADVALAQAQKKKGIKGKKEKA